MFDAEPDGATPIDSDLARGLLPDHLRTRDQLNAWEQLNILEASRWAFRTRKNPLEESFVRELHRRMFNRTWDWAGIYRSIDLNLGVDWPRIRDEIGHLLDDGRYWLKNETYSIDESALRLHHRMVQIHPFPNGNGRHGRMWCDAILHQHARQPFNWKNRELDKQGTSRSAYIHALQAADKSDYGPLIDLVLVDRAK